MQRNLLVKSQKSLNTTSDNFINYCSLVSFPSIPISKSTFVKKKMVGPASKIPLYKGHDS